MSAFEKPDPPPLDVKKLRRWGRFDADESQVELLTETGPRQGVIVDESYGGIGLLLDDVQGLTVGQNVQVVYYGAPVNAIIRRILDEFEGRCEVGIEWIKASAKDARPTDAAPAAADEATRHA